MVRSYHGGQSTLPASLGSLVLASLLRKFVADSFLPELVVKDTCTRREKRLPLLLGLEPLTLVFQV